MKDLKGNQKQRSLVIKGAIIRLMDDFSMETLLDGMQGNNALKVLKGENLQDRIQHPQKPSFKNEEEINILADYKKTNLRELLPKYPYCERYCQEFFSYTEGDPSWKNEVTGGNEEHQKGEYENKYK